MNLIVKIIFFFSIYAAVFQLVVAYYFIGVDFTPTAGLMFFIFFVISLVLTGFSADGCMSFLKSYLGRISIGGSICCSFFVGVCASLMALFLGVITKSIANGGELFLFIVVSIIAIMAPYVFLLYMSKSLKQRPG